MNRYAEEIDRLLMQGETLENLAADPDPHTESVLRVRGITDEEISGDDGEFEGEHIALLRAGLFYRFDAVEEAEQNLGEVVSPLADYWRSMIHRRGGDFELSRKESRRAGPLPFFAALHREASNISTEFGKQLNWDPYLFTHLYEQAVHGDSSHDADLIAIQKEEFEVVFDYTWRKASGESTNLSM